MLKQILALVVVMSASSAFAQPSSFLDAIFTAIKNNPRTVSTNELLESVYLATQGVKAQMLPSGGIGCSVNKSITDTNPESLPSFQSSSTSASCGVSANYVFYDGGAQKYRFLSAKAGADAMAASYNTSDSLIPNTRGALANNTKSAYEQLVMYRARIAFYKKMQERFIIFKKVSTDNILLARIQNLDQLLIEFQDIYDLTLRDFEFFVTQSPTADIDDLEATIPKIKIPLSVEDAIGVATERGPEVIRRNLNVQMAEFNVKAQKAAMGPQISLNGSVDHGTFRTRFDNTYKGTSTTKSVGVTFTLPLSPAAPYYLKSAEKDLASQRSQREAALKEAEHSLRSNYKSLGNQQKIYAQQKINLAEQEAYMQSLIDRIEAGDTRDMDITKMINSMGTLEGRFESLLGAQMNIFNNLYRIQQVTGLLFEQFNF